MLVLSGITPITPPHSVCFCFVLPPPASQLGKPSTPRVVPGWTLHRCQELVWSIFPRQPLKSMGQGPGPWGIGVGEVQVNIPLD